MLFLYVFWEICYINLRFLPIRAVAPTRWRSQFRLLAASPLYFYGFALVNPERFFLPTNNEINLLQTFYPVLLAKRSRSSHVLPAGPGDGLLPEQGRRRQGKKAAVRPKP